VPDNDVAVVYDCLFPLNAGGGERVYRRMAELLRDSGCAVDYVTRRQWADGDEPATTFTIKPVWSGALYDTTGTRTPASAIAFGWAVFRHFRRNRRRYDIVVVSALPVLNVFAVKLALIGTRPFLVVDWLEVWGWRKWRGYSGAVVGTVAALLQFLALRSGSLHTVNSNFTRERIRRYLPSADPVVLGLVDLASPPPNASTSRGPDAPLLYVGRHIADKRLTELPPALAFARKVVPGLGAVIVGSGPETEAVRRRGIECGVQEALEFTGRASDAELHERFAHARVLVNPSAREGFGLVVAEAAAFGTPSVVVAGADNAAADLVEDGVNGFVAASTRPEDLGEAIVRAIDGGQELRQSTLEWFRRERETNGLAVSVRQILERYRSSRAR
jgi:glycosyltransferase involved in cell wall biosynthesis